MSLDFAEESWAAFYAHAGEYVAGTDATVRPSSGWHVVRLALTLCRAVTLYGFRLDAVALRGKLHYYDSLVQSEVTEQMLDPEYRSTHRYGACCATLATLPAFVRSRGLTGARAPAVADLPSSTPSFATGLVRRGRCRIA